MTYRELTEQGKALLAEADRVMREAEALKAEERRQVIEQIKAMMAEWNINVADLGMRLITRLHKPEPKKAPIKYRDQAGNTWSGRGKRPRWFLEAIDRGVTVEELKAA
jgi:DNA-binding protein H-NS